MYFIFTSERTVNLAFIQNHPCELDADLICHFQTNLMTFISFLLVTRYKSGGIYNLQKRK